MTLLHSTASSIACLDAIYLEEDAIAAIDLDMQQLDRKLVARLYRIVEVEGKAYVSFGRASEDVAAYVKFEFAALLVLGHSDAAVVVLYGVVLIKGEFVEGSCSLCCSETSADWGEILRRTVVVMVLGLIDNVQ
jgi:hypothetical protein